MVVRVKKVLKAKSCEMSGVSFYDTIFLEKLPYFFAILIKDLK